MQFHPDDRILDEYFGSRGKDPTRLTFNIALDFYRQFPFHYRDSHLYLFYRVPPSRDDDLRRHVYTKMWWDAEQATHRCPQLRKLLAKLVEYGGDADDLMQFSFLPVEIFEILPYRNFIQGDRQRASRLTARYRNHNLKLSGSDPLLCEARDEWNDLPPALRDRCTTNDLLFRLLDGEQAMHVDDEHALFRSLHLKNTGNLTAHDIWNFVFIPLVRYLREVLNHRSSKMPRRKEDARVIPDKLFEFASSLVHLRYPDYWPENEMDLVKSR